jgi:hypothetical protein
VAVSSPTGSQDSLSAANLGHPGFPRQIDASLSLAEFAAEAAAAAAALSPPVPGQTSWGTAGDAYACTSSSNAGGRVPYNIAGGADDSTASDADCRTPHTMNRAPNEPGPQDQIDLDAHAQLSLALTTVHAGDKAAAAAAAALAAMAAAAAAPCMPSPSALVNPMVGLKPLSRVQLMAGALDVTPQHQGLGWSDDTSGFSKGHRSASTPGSTRGGLLLAYRGSMAGSTSAQRVSSTERQYAAVSEAGFDRGYGKHPEGTRLWAATTAGSRVSSSGRSNSSLMSEQMSLMSTPRSAAFSTLSSNSSCSRHKSVTDSCVGTGQQVALLYRSPSKMQAMTGKGQLSWEPTGLAVATAVATWQSHKLP